MGAPFTENIDIEDLPKAVLGVSLCENRQMLMNSFSAYTTQLGEFTDKVLLSPAGSYKAHDIQDSIFNAKQLEKRLRELIPIEELRDAGSFFTGDILADKAVGFFSDSVSRKSVIIDPACGAGSLLIACSRRLPVVNTSLRKTLKLWGQCLGGLDLFKEFVESTKLRLVLEAVSRGASPDIHDLDEIKILLPYIQEGDAFDNANMLTRATHIIVNPPYYQRTAGETCEWADGKINAAAKFMELIANHTRKGCLVSAILPDVLRSGSRYEKWRTLIAGKLACSVTPSGRFDRKTDVDVFLFGGVVASSEKEPDWLGVDRVKTCVGDLFDISIGPVVPYRDMQKGIAVPYIHPRNLAVWDEVKDTDISETWKFSGTLKKPPFVAIRRTSSPADTYRAAATLIKGKQKIAVENHLIIARPKSGRIRDCKILLQALQDPKTNVFLNQRIRCRHLTVAAVKEIPLIGESV